MEADFSYNVADWEPEVSYDVSGDTGKLRVRQGSGGGIPGGDARNEWDIRFNDAVPTDLHLEMGAGESNLDLDSLTLTGLDLQMGAGETTVDLTGDYGQDLEASIQGGVGEATVLLPSEVGVRAKAEGGIGEINAEGLQREGDSYVNDAYGDSEVNLEVDVQGGVGEIHLEVV
jgi:predicted membrane protein